MRTRRSYRRRAWVQRIALVLLLAVVATLVIARIGAEPVVGEVSYLPGGNAPGNGCIAAGAYLYRRGHSDPGADTDGGGSICRRLHD